jgi:hypothetical protein
MNPPIAPHYNQHTSKFTIHATLFITTFLGIILFCMVNYLGYKFYQRKDLTQSRINELSPRTLKPFNLLAARSQSSLTWHSIRD